jgi:hypothetical protein
MAILLAKRGVQSIESQKRWYKALQCQETPPNENISEKVEAPFPIRPDPWSSAINALIGGLSPDAIRSGFRKTSKCAVSQPNPQQSEQLLDLLEKRGITDLAGQRDWIQSIRCTQQAQKSVDAPEPASDVWRSLARALEAGLNPDAVQETIRKRSPCITEPPSGNIRSRISELITWKIPDETQRERWIESFRCNPSPEVLSSAVVAPKIELPTLLRVRTDLPEESVQLNGRMIGSTPLEYTLTSFGSISLAIGTGEFRRDTVLTLTPGQTVYIELASPDIDGNSAIPPRDQVEEQLRPALPSVPDIGASPKVPKPPSVGSSLLAGLVAGGGAAAIAQAPCKSMATAPSPYGGFRGSRYYESGTVASDMLLACAGAAGGGALVLGTTLFHALRRGLYAGKQRAYEKASTEYLAAVANRQRIAKQNEAAVDSAWALRKRNIEKLRAQREFRVLIREPDVR